jgi:hypothetical protein
LRSTDGTKRRDPMDNTQETRKIEIDQNTLKHLDTLRKWTMFHAILGFIVLGLFVIIGVIAGTFLSAFSTVKTGSEITDLSILIIIFLLSVAYFFPVFFLFRFSKYSARAIHTHSKEYFHRAIKNLKAYFIYLGVIIILFLLLYVVVLIVSGTSLGFPKGML